MNGFCKLPESVETVSIFQLIYFANVVLLFLIKPREGNLNARSASNKKVSVELVPRNVTS